MGFTGYGRTYRDTLQEVFHSETMHYYLHLALLPVALFVSSQQVRAQDPGKPADAVSAINLADWEFITATPTELRSVCVPGGDGVLSIMGKPVGYIATKASRENYQLHFEWRWPADAAKNCNGGALLHIASGPAGGTQWPVCFQVQLKMDHAGDLLPMNTARFSETLSTAPDAKTPQLDRRGDGNEKPPGEWNSGDVVCRGDTVEVSINGVVKNHISQCSPAAGKIGFQLEGAPFELRNVSISPLVPVTEKR